MSNRPPATVPTIALLAVALVLPIAVVVIVGVAALLSALGDAVGGRVLAWIGLGVGIVWLVDLVCLVILQALLWLADRPSVSREPDAEL
jgi:hypothetical protein